ncbi:MAG: hypothetical protein AB7J34_06110 [Limisphaerales bacterium]
MKLLQRDGDRLVFRMSAREKRLLERLLGFYPIQSEATQRLSKGADPRLEEADKWLAEARKEQRSELSGWLSRRLCQGAAFVPAGSGWKLVLDGADVERLLQVLNELRVGSWLKLGRPEDLDFLAPDDEAIALAPLHGLMLLTGEFEMVLIRAMLDDPEPPSAEGI